MKKENIFYAFLFGIVAYVLAESFFIAMTNPNNALGFLLVAFALILILVTGVYHLGFLVGFILTITFFAIFAGPYSVAECLNRFKEIGVTAAVNNPSKYQDYISDEQGLWNVNQNDLRVCKNVHGLGAQINGMKELLGFE